MKKILLALLWGLISLSVHAENFYIQQFDVDVKVEQSGEFEVTETIRVVFTKKSHGIIRDLLISGENTQPGQGKAYRSLKFPMEVSNIRVDDDPFTTQKTTNGPTLIKIKMGAADKYIEGEHTYIIRYHVKYAINHFEDHSEFYWNITGNNWPTTIDKVNFTIHLPNKKNLPATDIEYYTGKGGETRKKAIFKSQPGLITGHTTTTLLKFEGLTLAFRVPANYFTREDLPALVSHGQQSYTQNSGVNISLQPDGSLKVKENYSLITTNLTELVKTFPSGDLPLEVTEIELGGQPNWNTTFSSGKLTLKPKDQQPINGTVNFTLNYTLRGFFDQTLNPQRRFTWPVPTLTGVSSAMETSIKLEFPEGITVASDSIKAEWVNLPPWGKSENIHRDAHSIGGTQKYLTANKVTSIRFTVPSSLFQVPEMPARFYTKDYMFREYEVHLTVSPDEFVQIDHRFIVESPNGENRVISAGLANYKNNFEPFLATYFDYGKQDWKPKSVDYYEKGVDVRIEEMQTSGKETDPVFGIGGGFAQYEFPNSADQSTHTLSYRQFGWLEKYGNDYSALIPAIMMVPRAVRKTTLRITLPAGATLTENISSGVLYDGSGLHEGSQIKFQKAGDDWIAEVPRTLFNGEYIVANLAFPDTGMTGAGFGTELGYWMRNNRHLWITGLFVLGFFIVLYLIWWWVGRDEKVTIVPQYGPPEGVTPPEAGILWDGKLHTKDLMTLIPWWAGRGLIEIEKSGKAYSFKMLKVLPGSAKNFERSFWKGMFKKEKINKVVTGYSLQNAFYIHFKSASTQLKQWGVTTRVFVPGTRAFGKLMFWLGIILIPISLFMVSETLGKADILPEYSTSIPTWGAVFICAIMLIIFGRIMPKRGNFLKKEYAHLLGFREFIKTAEEDRLIALSEENPSYFDETLPYAIVFGLAKVWSKKFNGILTESRIQTTGDNQLSPNEDLSDLTRDFLRDLNVMHHTITYHSPPRSGSSSSGSSSSSSSYSYNSSSSSNSYSASSGGSSFDSGGGYSGGGFGGGGGSSW